MRTLLDMHRARYIDQFLRGMERYPHALPECLMHLDYHPPEELFKLYRADLLRQVGEEYKMVELRMEQPLDHKPFVEQRGDVVIEVRPFPWDRCIIEALVERLDRDALVAWGTHWIDVDDVRPKDEDGLQGVIHHVSYPSYPWGKLTFLVDFGTAPVQAAIELTRVLTAGAKAARITLGADEPQQ